MNSNQLNQTVLHYRRQFVDLVYHHTGGRVQTGPFRGMSIALEGRPETAVWLWMRPGAAG
jgi:hypothetical protein